MKGARKVCYLCGRKARRTWWLCIDRGGDAKLLYWFCTKTCRDGAFSELSGTFYDLPKRHRLRAIAIRAGTGDTQAVLEFMKELGA